MTAHPDQDALTHTAARRLGELIGDAHFAHLAAEGFDPRFTAHDRTDYLDRTRTDEAIVAEQRRVDDAAHLVLVFPVFWWTTPALLKGWIDRVFIAGWAFDFGEDDAIVPRLQRLTMHLLPIASTEEESFARHGYAEAFSAQLEHGVMDFCGIQRGVTAFVYDSERDNRDALAIDVGRAVSAIAAAIR